MFCKGTMNEAYSDLYTLFSTSKEEPSSLSFTDYSVNKKQLPSPLGLTLKNSSSATETTCHRRSQGKKDRHSKILTKQGPRDRRMRLSLGIARKFFDLQDMLGFDKASNTVEWLLTKSKNAIKEITRCSSKPTTTKSGNSTSDCEVISGLDDSVNASIDKPFNKEKKTARLNSRQTVSEPISKEMRANARARARERTRKKMLMPEKIAETGESVIGLSELNLNPSLIFDYPNQYSLGINTSFFSENWNLGEPSDSSSMDLSIAGNVHERVGGSIFMTPDISLQTPFNDFHQLYPKPWDPYNG